VQEPLQSYLGSRSKSKNHDKQLTHIVRVRGCCYLIIFIPYRIEIILGIKTINPIIDAAIELIRTPAADKSFIILIVSCFCGETKSAIFSIAELIISTTNTNPIAKIMAIHSKGEILKNIEAIITQKVAARCILALCSSIKRIRSPLKAGAKLFILLSKENLFFIWLY
jgi:hypothetical protein